MKSTDLSSPTFSSFSVLSLITNHMGGAMFSCRKPNFEVISFNIIFVSKLVSYERRSLNRFSNHSRAVSEKVLWIFRSSFYLCKIIYLLIGSRYMCSSLVASKRLRLTWEIHKFLDILRQDTARICPKSKVRLATERLQISNKPDQMLCVDLLLEYGSKLTLKINIQYCKTYTCCYFYWLAFYTDSSAVHFCLLPTNNRCLSSSSY